MSPRKRRQLTMSLSSLTWELLSMEARWRRGTNADMNGLRRQFFSTLPNTAKQLGISLQAHLIRTCIGRQGLKRFSQNSRRICKDQHNGQ